MSADEISAATSACTPQYQDASDLIESNSSAVQSALDALDISTCSYQKSSGAAGACVFPVGCGGAAYTEQSATGCESINMVSNVMNQVTSNLSCTLNSSSAELDSTASNIQEITMEIGSISSGSTVTIGQTSSTTTKFVNLTQADVQSNIAATIEQGMQSSLTQSQESNAGDYSDPTSQKQVAQTINDMQSVTTSDLVNTSVANTSMNIQSSQKITLQIGSISDSNVTITQDNCFDLVAENYVYNTLSQVVQTSSVQSDIADLTQSSENDNAGLSSLLSFGSFGTILIICLVVFLVYKFVIKKNNKGRPPPPPPPRNSYAPSPFSNTYTPPPPPIFNPAPPPSFVPLKGPPPPPSVFQSLNPFSSPMSPEISRAMNPLK
jgi:hypothetical protein